MGWHLLILAASLALFSVLLYLFLSRSLYRHHDAELAIEAERLAQVLADVDFSQETTALVLLPSQVSEEFLIVRNPQGRLLYRSPLLEITEPNIGEHEALVHAATLGVAAPQFFTAQLERTGPVRFICVPINRPPRAYLQLGRPLGEVPETLRTVAVACAVLVPVILVLMSFSGWVIAGRALAPMKAINETLQAIQATDLSRRLQVPPDAELGGLVTTVNRLLARLEKAFSSLKQFTADISHQLQTPLTVMKGTADVTLTLGSTRTPEEYQRALTEIGEEIDDMTSLLRDLRALSLADAGPGASEHGAVSLSDVAREVAEILEALAESKHIAVDTALDSGLTVWGSGIGLKQVLLNLVDNADQVHRNGGPNSVSASTGGT
jgi:signal transduction histidine kinase